MNYKIVGISDTREFSKSGLEKALLELLKNEPRDCFYIASFLPISLKAKVVRKPGEREVVRLSSGKKTVEMFRDVDGKPGDIRVSCNLKGENVPVDTINIQFRSINDTFMDRGLIWVTPTSPANMLFVLKKKALETPGMVKQILETAEKIVEKTILSLFS